MRTIAATVAVALSLVAAVDASAQSAPVPEGAVWTEHTIPSTDGVQLHADVLRPEAAGDEKTPVILMIGPYFGHSGQLGAVALAQPPEPYDPVGPSEGPSARFHDLINGAKLIERGYSVVMVDLRGFGGSSGCLDWAGPGEQADVVAAVEWAASRDWSNGRVGMYGKSYDAVTGLAGVAQQPEGLEAVVAQEPVYDMYRYLFGDGIRRQNSVITPALYTGIDATPGPAADDPLYTANGANDTSRPGCKPLNYAEQAGNSDHFSPYWRVRDFITGAEGSDVPVFLTQGLPENNTVSDGLAQYLEAHDGYERAWLGPWDHVRGGETTSSGQLKMGRAGWYDEVVRFYDRFLKGETPAVEDPMIAVQTNDGKWRGEDQWPPADAVRYTSDLRSGAYTDDGSGTQWGSGAASGIWTISPPLAHDAHLAGSGRAVVDISTPVPNSNLVVSVYDIDASGVATHITRQGHLLPRNGAYTLDLWSADWKIPAGHRVGVRVSDADTNWWTHVGTRQDVTVYGGSVELPFLTYTRPDTIQGDPGVQLGSYTSRRVTLPAATIAAAESPGFALPPAQVPEATEEPPPPPPPPTKKNGKPIKQR
jgi:predicted acyl esterase